MVDARVPIVPHSYGDSVLLRFWSKVTVGESDACWPWTAYRHKDGYGRFQPGGRGVGKVNAQRFAYLVCIGPLRSDDLVRHTCDNPACCNPRHLLVGTHQQNMDDKRQRGRQSFQLGEHAPNRKLDWEKVDFIRRCGGSICAVAREFGVAKSTISSIRNGHTWSDVGRVN